MAAVLCLASIPMAWATGAAFVGRASVTAVDLWPIGIGSAIAAAFYVLAALCLRWRRRFAAGAFGLFASLCSLAFALVLLVLGSLLQRLTDLVVDDVASVSAGVGVWLLLASSVIGLVGSVSALFSPPRTTDADGATAPPGTSESWWSKTV